MRTLRPNSGTAARAKESIGDKEIERSVNASTLYGFLSKMKAVIYPLLLALSGCSVTLRCPSRDVRVCSSVLNRILVFMKAAMLGEPA